METDKSSSILDWLESVPTDADSLLILDSVRGLAGPPRLCQRFPICSSSVSHARRSFHCTTQKMAYNFFNDEFTYAEAQAIEVMHP
jgi:hypothetical protein